MLNNLDLGKATQAGGCVKNICTRIYRPGMSISGFIQNISDYVGDKNATIGAAIVSFIAILLSFSLFATFFAILFAIMLTFATFIIAKVIFYKPREESITLEDGQTVLSFVKYVYLDGRSEINIHSQREYDKKKHSFAVIRLCDSITILDCRNITFITDNNYHNVVIHFFYPIKEAYSVQASSEGKPVRFEVLQQTADNVQITFLNPVPKTVKIECKFAE